MRTRGRPQRHAPKRGKTKTAKLLNKNGASKANGKGNASGKNAPEANKRAPRFSQAQAGSARKLKANGEKNQARL